MANKSVLSALTSAFSKSYMAPVDNRGGWWPWVREPYAGAWQNNDEWTIDSVLAYPAVYSCISLISSDIGKLRPTIQRLNSDGIWQEVTDRDVSPLLARPNRYQNHIQFKEWWITSKLIRGNTYALKGRDNGNTVRELYILDPERVQVLVSPDGSVFYQLGQDNLNGQEESSVTVPASEIIHDRMNCLFHPLVGISPLFASGLAASQGIKIQNDSKKFFDNGAQPGGVLTAPGAISDETAARLKSHWDANYTGQNSGKVAVLGDGLSFEQMRMNSTDAQLIEQLKWTAEAVCTAFDVPAYKVGVGDMPTYNNIEALTQGYYSQCLQVHIESMELSLKNGLAISESTRIELDLDALFRMDSATKIKTLRDGVEGGIYAPNEARKRMNLKPLEGGDTVYLQQQNYSLEALARRDAQEDPFSSGSGNSPVPAEPPEDDDPDDEARMLAMILEKELSSETQ
ncbi:phage portal protein [Marinobacter sp. M1N3S26]|uniref:phage portal protein n=1 Tax=Marinobacter sp. M1N3S26 TaxID=3382299 RepID=UPI00387A89B1